MRTPQRVAGWSREGEGEKWERGHGGGNWAREHRNPASSVGFHQRRREMAPSEAQSRRLQAMQGKDSVGGDYTRWRKTRECLPGPGTALSTLHVYECIFLPPQKPTKGRLL